MLDIILKIIPIIISIPAMIVAIKSLKLCNEISCKLKEDNKSLEDDFNVDEFLYSLEFNTKLDGMIVPLLGKMTNNQITISIIERLYKEDPKAAKIPREKLGDHITDTLRNYQNSYNKEALERLLDREQSTSESYRTKLDHMDAMMDGYKVYINMKDSIDEPVEERSKGKTGESPVHNLSNVLNNFYKD